MGKGKSPEPDPKSRILEIRFQIPLRGNPKLGSGMEHGSFRWQLLKNALIATFGVGATWPPNVSGIWQDPETGEIEEEESSVFLIDVEEGRLEEIRRILRRACRTFEQKAIRMVVRGEVEYLEARPNDPPL